MDPAAILALYDQERRSGIEVPGMRREVTDCTIRGIDLSGHQSWVVLSRLAGRTIDDVIRQEVSYFESLGHDFEWKVHAHESPPDLKELLAVRGFEIDETESILALDLTEPRPSWPSVGGLEVRRITDPEKIGEVVMVNEQVWGEGRTWLSRRLADDLRNVPDLLSVYLVCADGVPACSGWIYFNPASQFAGLWGGSTLPAFRRRGLYTALLAARMNEAQRRGVRFLTIDARHMSRPIAEKHGFAVLTQATGCIWRVRRGRLTGTERSPAEPVG
jgi:GNAT superfamily N-acetyltransferase